MKHSNVRPIIRSSPDRFNYIGTVLVGMSDLTVPDLTGEPLEVRMNYPEWLNEDQDELREQRKEELKELLPDADIVGVVDTDSDGLACEVVIEEAFSDQNTVVVQGDGGKYGFDLPTMLQFVGDNTTEDTDVIIADLAPDEKFSSFVAGVCTIPGSVRIFDHHDWDWFVEESMSAVTDELHMGDDKCAAQVLQEEILPNPSETIKDFLTVTADNDLWIKEDPRSDHLSTLSFALDKEDYVEYAREYGADMVAESEEVADIYNETVEESERRIELACERAETITVGDMTVSLTYGDCYHSQVGENLLQDGADLAVIIKPMLKISFRSADDYPICSELAKSLGGGGHEHAAGANIYNRVQVSDDVNKLEHTWDTEGEQALEYMKGFLRDNL